MTTEHPPASSGSRRKRILLLSFLGFAVVVLLLGIIGAVADTDDDESKNSAAGSSTRASATTSARAAAPATVTAAPATTTAAPPAPLPTSAAPAVVPGASRSPRCQPVPDRYLAAVNGSFTDSRYSLSNAWAINGSDGVWIGGHIMDGDRRVSSADVWYAKGAAVWSLSGGARRNSQLPDGRHILNLSAGDDDGIAVQGCVTAR
ncbi:hypothetical protein [Nocardia nova]|nr:hypothetical protein [Nocardia nova]